MSQNSGSISNKTLWELAQDWEHDNTGTVFEPLHAPEICRRCQLEQWAREKAEEYNDSLYAQMAPNALMRNYILDDLGVPEDDDGKR